MQRASAIAVELEQIITIEDLTGVFESLSSTQIAKVKGKVQLSTQFFERLWRVYSALRVDPKARITYSAPDVKAGQHRKVFVMITAEGGLSGDIDDRLMRAMLEDYDPSTIDIVVIGDHGANQLTQRGMPFISYFKVPESENYIDVSPILAAIAPYPDITVYYESYESLGVQTIKKIDLIYSVKAMSQNIDPNEEVITAYDTVFEPSLDEIIEQMEITMIGLAFSQVILASSLAQYASRFNAMVVAKKRAVELATGFGLDFHRAKRAESDRRLREVMVSLKKKKKLRG